MVQPNTKFGPQRGSQPEQQNSFPASAHTPSRSGLPPSAGSVHTSQTMSHGLYALPAMWAPQRILVICPNHYGHIKPLSTLALALANKLPDYRIDFSIVSPLRALSGPDDPRIKWKPLFDKLSQATNIHVPDAVSFSEIIARYTASVPGLYIMDHFFRNDCEHFKRSMNTEQQQACHFIMFFSGSASYFNEYGWLSEIPRTLLQGVIVNSVRLLESSAVATMEAALRTHGIHLWTIASMFGPSMNGYEHHSLIDGRHVPTLVATQGSASTATLLRAGFLAEAVSKHKSAHYHVTIAASIPRSKQQAFNAEMGALGSIETRPINQQTVMSLPGVHGHITAGGWNSICETLMAGKPMLVYAGVSPDQKINACLLESMTPRLAVASYDERPRPCYESNNSIGKLCQHYDAFLQTLPTLKRNAEDFRARLNSEGRLERNQAFVALVAQIERNGLLQGRRT